MLFHFAPISSRTVPISRILPFVSTSVIPYLDKTLSASLIVWVMPCSSTRSSKSTFAVILLIREMILCQADPITSGACRVFSSEIVIRPISLSSPTPACPAELATFCNAVEISPVLFCFNSGSLLRYHNCLYLHIRKDYIFN